MNEFFNNFPNNAPSKLVFGIILRPKHLFRLTCGTTWHSAAMMNTLRSSVNESKLMYHTKNVVATIEDETGISPGWIKHGGLTVTKNDKYLDELRY